MAKLSVIVITFNEAANIRDCLASVSWADEIIVLDSGSTDGTVSICREFTASVYVSDWPGFGAQKNRCLDKAQYEWVLSIDADERVSLALRAEIEHAITEKTYHAWRMPRHSGFCGQFMRYSGWRPDYVLRLFKRDSAYFSNDVVHERLICQGQIGTLTEPLIHYSIRNLDNMLDKMNRYSSLGARQIQQQGKSASLLGAVLHGLWTFIRTYFLQFGFLDGKKGFILAVANAEGTYYRYLKAMFLDEQEK
jgi:glycosyltransferase involved in cell wall biosynthesis